MPVGGAKLIKKFLHLFQNERNVVIKRAFLFFLLFFVEEKGSERVDSDGSKQLDRAAGFGPLCG